MGNRPSFFAGNQDLPGIFVHFFTLRPCHLVITEQRFLIQFLRPLRTDRRGMHTAIAQSYCVAKAHGNAFPVIGLIDGSNYSLESLSFHQNNDDQYQENSEQETQ